MINKRSVRSLKEINLFMLEMKEHRHNLSKQTISTLKGQALAGDVEGARKGLDKALSKKQSNRDKMVNAHRGAKYLTKQYDGIDYKTQIGIYLKVLVRVG